MERKCFAFSLRVGKPNAIGPALVANALDGHFRFRRIQMDDVSNLELRIAH